MYCPRCGRQPITNELRFCSYCGFKLGVVKAALTDTDEAAPAVSTDARTVLLEPRARDINVGVILMFAGTLFSIALGRMEGREAAALALAIFYSLTLVFSSPITKAIFKLFSWDEQRSDLSAGRKEMCFGSTLMFISTAVLTVASQLIYGRMRTEEFFVGLSLTFALLVVSSRFFMKGLQSLVTEENVSISHSHGSSDQIADPGFNNLLLPVGQDEPVSAFAAQRVQTAEIVQPISITEHTTNLLDKKQ